MFGSGVAVCAAHFPALSELVRQNENGVVFRDKEELFEQMYSLLFREKHSLDAEDKPRPSTVTKNWMWESEELRFLRENAAKISTWDENWEKHMKPVVQLTLKMTKSLGVLDVTDIVIFLMLGITAILVKRYLTK
jgi:hypothetical protein